MPNRVGTAGIDQRQVGVEARFPHPFDEVVRDAGLVAGRAGDVDQIDEDIAHGLGGDMGGGPGEIGMGHERSV